MKQIIDSFIEACCLLITFDSEIYKIIALSLLVSVSSTLGSAVIAVPLGIVIGTRNFKGKKFLVRIINTFMGLPPVIAGLVVYLFLSNKGPLGPFKLLFTPIAMIIAQLLIVTPIIIGLTISAVKHKYLLIMETCKGLGMKYIKIMWMLFKECKYPIWAAILAGYGRASAEVGAVMLVGGNIQYSTRVMTTSIVLETGKGNYDKALAIGIILILITFVVNWILQYFQEEI